MIRDTLITHDDLVKLTKDLAIGHGFRKTLDDGSNREKVCLKYNKHGIYYDRCAKENTLTLHPNLLVVIIN